MKKIFLSIYFSVIVGTFLFASPALAARNISVSGAHDPIFDRDDIYPGFSIDDTVTVSNTGDEPVDVYFRFNIQGDGDLADQLKLYVIRADDDNYRLGGEGDRMTVDDADEEGALFIDRLGIKQDGTGQSEEYRIKITFNKDAGNEYQGKSAKFNLELGYETEPASGNPPIRGGFTGRPPQEKVAGVSVPEEGVAGDETQLAGAETKCQSWPEWVWVMAAIIYSLILLQGLKRGYDKEKVVWKLAIILTVAGVAFWYFFDKCRESQWFLYAIITIGILSYFVYLWKLKKKVKAVSP